MNLPAIFASLALLAALSTLDARAERSTVCTVTVNSPDEREMFRRSLPEDKFQLVELVERGRPDWLASACRQNVRCDVLVISGHFDGGTEFYSDRVGARESLPVDELERASCSASCSGLFSQLKEVYLFGCNTLNPATVEATASEVARSLVRSGSTQADADELARALNANHGESNRDAMRRIFANVPVIYGFPGQAPLGVTAGPILGRYLQATASRDVGSGRASAALLGAFSAASMSSASGMLASDTRSDYRRDVCQFFDEQRSPAQKLSFIHSLLRREMAEVRMFFERIEAFDASLTDAERTSPAFLAELEAIAADESARDRYLRYARDVDRAEVRARMIQWAGKLGWLSPQEQTSELARLASDRLADPAIASSDVDLICSLDRDGALDHRVHDDRPIVASDSVARSAALACLGRPDARERVLRALTGGVVSEVDLAQVYLSHRPIGDVHELRSIAAGIATMTDADAQVRALETLARYYLSDRESLSELARLFPRAVSVSVQRAIAGVFIRSDARAVADLDLGRIVRRYRLKSPDGGEDLIDVLLRRLHT
ncbi:MAG TPA: hypothetical protein VGH59_02010 [Casimicrobiaceae bacterium]